MEPARNRSHLTRGYTAALISAAILSTTAIFIRHLTQTYRMPALVLAFWRDVFVVLTLLPVLGGLFPRLLRVERRHLPALVAYGLVLAAFNAMWTLSVALNGAAVATVLAYCSVGFTALLGWWLLKERLGWAKLVAIALSLIGCALVSRSFSSGAFSSGAFSSGAVGPGAASSGAANPGAGRVNLAGILTGILSGLFYAIYSLMGRATQQRGLNPWTVLLYTFGLAALFLLALNLVPGGLVPGAAVRPADMFWLGSAWAGWGILFLLAAGPTVTGFGLYNVSLGLLPSSVANLIVTLEPAFTAVAAFFLLGERLDGMQIGGGLMILAGVAWLRVAEGR